ncbi:MAG: ribose-5-phosphate isomerase RpiA [Chloroflexaceae bacterium]|jgi:ribose 5-phosphate isomerase A|nr:ribose-5-phosphate isomerase RpiA [Chloroflexaceae bacterium]
MQNQEALKRLAAKRAVDYIASESVIGLGTGSTMRYALEELGRRLADGHLYNVAGVPTSEQTATLARQLGIPVLSLADVNELALAIDGADEIDPQLNLIKGRGGALLREKVVASLARTLLIIADSSKLVPQLGSHMPLPVEVVPFAVPLIQRRLAALGGQASERLMAAGQPYRTDNGNAILDYACGPIADPAALDLFLLRTPGVVDHGLFLGMAGRAIVADGTSIRELQREPA